MFSNKKREGIDAFVCAVYLYVAETPKTLIKDHEPPLPIMPCGFVAYGFVGQPGGVGHDSQSMPGEIFPGAHFHLIAERQTSPRADGEPLYKSHELRSSSKIKVL